MTIAPFLGGNLRSALMIDESNWNTGKIIVKPGITAVKCFQRVGTSYTLAVPGFYKGSAPATVEVRTIDQVSGGTVVDWATLDAAPANNAFTGTTSVPQGNLDGSYLYSIQVRDSANPSVITTSYTIIAVGIGVLWIGQSNAEKPFGQFTVTPMVASAGVFRYSGGQYIGWYKNDTLSQPDEPTATNGIDGFAGDGCTAFGNTMVATTRVPVFILEMAIGATTIATWQTLANGGTHTSWDNLLTQIGRAVALGYGFEIVKWQQGETDAVNGLAKATYMTGITNLFNQCLTLSGRAHIIFILGLLSRDLSATDAHGDAISQAILAWYDGVRFGSIVLGDVSAATYLDLMSQRDQYDSAADPHLDTAQYRILGYRDAAGSLFRMGLTATGVAGPLFAGTLTASALTQTITLPITQDAGTALLDHSGSAAGTGLTGFRAFNGVTAKTISSTAFSGNNIVLTLAAASFIATDTINVDYMFGGGSSLPVVWNITNSTGNPVYDNVTVPNTGLGRPLQPTRGQISGTAGI